MASEKPAVSTPVHDVVQLYGVQVALANAGKAFVDACEMLLAETAQARQRRAEAMLQTVFTRSWDHTVGTTPWPRFTACCGPPAPGLKPPGRPRIRQPPLPPAPTARRRVAWRSEGGCLAAPASAMPSRKPAGAGCAVLRGDSDSDAGAAKANRR